GILRGRSDTMAPAARSARRDQTMNRSTERVLTTHVGSLPRGPTVLELLYKKENGEAYDAAAFDAAVAAAVDDVVAKQVAVGIDVVSDGEARRLGYAT